MFAFCDGYVVEGARDDNPQWAENESNAAPRLKITPSLYRAHFYETEHENYISYYSSVGPLLISIKRETNSVRTLMYTESGIEHSETPMWNIIRPWYYYLLCREPKNEDVVPTIKPQITEYRLKPLPTEEHLQQEILRVYEPEFGAQNKIGLMYCRQGQTTEQEMFANMTENASPEYLEFLEFLGEKITLQGFTGYAGGLDTTRNYSGTQSVYTRYNDSEIMFHVCTLLPYSSTNTTQIERKKHIGNDRLVIVFKDSGDEAYFPNTMKSKQTQAIILIQPVSAPSNVSDLSSQNTKEKGKEVRPEGVTVELSADSSSSSNPSRSGSECYYKMSIAQRIEIPQSDPRVPEPNVFRKDDDFRDFLMRKITSMLIAMRHSPTFETKTQREKNIHFLHLVNKYLKPRETDALLTPNRYGQLSDK